MPDREEIGKRIRAARKKLHLSQKELGARIGISKSAICNYETGDNIPSDRIKTALSEVLRVDVADLFFR